MNNYGSFADVNVGYLKRRVITIPEWGNKEYILQELTGVSAAALVDKLPQDSAGVPQVNGAAFALILSLSLVDEAGRLIFDTDEKVKMLENQSISVLQRLANEVLEMSGINPLSTGGKTGLHIKVKKAQRK